MRGLIITLSLCISASCFANPRKISLLIKALQGLTLSTPNTNFIASSDGVVRRVSQLMEKRDVYAATERGKIEKIGVGFFVPTFAAGLDQTAPIELLD